MEGMDEVGMMWSGISSVDLLGFRAPPLSNSKHSLCLEIYFSIFTGPCLIWSQSATHHSQVCPLKFGRSLVWCHILTSTASVLFFTSTLVNRGHKDQLPARCHTYNWQCVAGPKLNSPYTLVQSISSIVGKFGYLKTLQVQERKLGTTIAFSSSICKTGDLQLIFFDQRHYAQLY